jgi:plasmid stabilization system protein ParE
VKLRYTPAAIAELAEVLDYIAERSPRAARSIHARVQAISHLILQHPRAGQPQHRGRLRRIVVYPYPYLIFYQIVDDEIVIHGVRHAARKPSSMPK